MSVVLLIGGIGATVLVFTVVLCLKLNHLARKAA